MDGEIVNEPSQAGRRCFLAGSVVLIAFGAVHVLAVYQANFTTQTDPQLAELDAAAKAYTVRLGPFSPTAFGAIQILNASYSILLVHAGVLNLLICRAAISTGRLKAVTVCNSAFVALLLVVTVLFQFPPPMVFAATALILFVSSWAKQR